MRDVLLLGAPIIIHATATSIMTSIDKLILEKFLPLSEVGIYTLGYKFGVIMTILVLSINRAWVPNYYDLMNQEDTDRAHELRRAFCIWMTALGAICITGGVWSKELIRMLTTEQYFRAAEVVPLILLGYFMQGVHIFMAAPLFYFKKTLLMPVLTVSGAIINIGLNLFLIPRIGIMGAAYATVVSFFVIAVGAYFVGRRFFDAHYEVARHVVLLLTISVVCVGMQWLDPGWFVKALIVPGYLLLCLALFPGYLKPLAGKVFSYGGHNR
jgi:O-antigen/teichoic acid export membrane protein